MEAGPHVNQATNVKDNGSTHRFAFVMEQTLGHVTHYRNMRAAIDMASTVDASWYPLTFPPRGTLETLPVMRSNWSVRASFRAWRTLTSHDATRYDALFFHTQVTTLLCTRLMHRVPSIISLDATPLNYDAVGASYGHQQSGAAAEVVKRLLNKRALEAASALVTWCEWARRSLIDDYGIDSQRIAVIPPGVNLVQWPQPRPKDTTGPVRILFVGADLTRKGGDALLQAFQANLTGRCELHLVTKSALGPSPGVYVYRDIAPNSDQLKHLYATADLFVLPTLADCFPLVIQEAMAAGLPVIATDVGAIGEAVHDGHTGILVPPGDVAALGAALDTLVCDPTRRHAMGMQGRLLAEQRFDSAANAYRIVNIMTSLAHERAGRR